jgi:hypothetical protein
MRELPQMPPECIKAFNEVSKIGADQGYGPEDWLDESYYSHLLKGIGHLMDFLLRRGAHHLAQGMWRVCAAVAVYERKRINLLTESSQPLSPTDL